MTDPGVTTPDLTATEQRILAAVMVMGQESARSAGHLCPLDPTPPNSTAGGPRRGLYTPRQRAKSPRHAVADTVQPTDEGVRP